MKYPIAIEQGDDEFAYGVIFPDLEGCFSAGDTYEEAISNAQEALELYIEPFKESGTKLPLASQINDHKDKPEFKGYAWSTVETKGSQT